MRRLIAFLKSRPTETWLGLWAAVVAVLVAAGVTLPAGVASAVSAVIGWLVTFVASRDTNELGPQPPANE